MIEVASKETSTELFSLAGRTVLITGSTSGLGLAMAAGMAAAGARVVVHGRDLSRARGVAQGIAGAVACAFDLASEAGIDSAIAALLREVGSIDVLVASAGARDRRPMEDITRADFHGLMETNLMANYQLARLLSPPMAQRGWGRLIFVTSAAAMQATPRSPSYVASKAGLAGLTRSMAVALGPSGVTSNAISPGVFATEFNAASLGTAGFQAMITQRIPLRRAGLPEEIVGAAVFLASRAGAYVNGHTLTLDGGLAVAI